MIASWFRQPVVASLLTAATVLAVLLPPSHIHLKAHDDDHDQDHAHDHAAVVEHSHWSSHGPSRAALDDDDGRAILVQRPAITSSIETTIARPAAALIALLTVPAPLTFTAVDRPTSGNSPRDGPSRRSTALRAPPAFDTL